MFIVFTIVVRTYVRLLSENSNRYLHLAERIIDEIYLVDPRGRPQSGPVVITIFRQSVRPSVRSKT